MLFLVQSHTADGSGMKAGPRVRIKNRMTMNNLLNIIIVLLIAGWLVGYIGFGAMVGNLIHILLIVAVVVILYRILGGRKAPL